MNTSSEETDYHKEDVYGEAFDRYEKMLRTWFVAYGIGGPVLLMTQESWRRALATAPNGKWIGVLFLAGVAVQVLESFFYKMCMWQLYYHEAEKDDKCRWMYECSKWVERNFLIDIIFDLTTIALFTIATVMVFPIVFN
jgi:hypothetical protein